MIFVDGGNDVVGIGTSEPNSYNDYANNLVVLENGHAGITIVAGTSNNSSLYFADGTSGNAQYRGWVDYLHASDSLRLATGGDARLTINSSGDVFVVKTSSGYGTNGHELLSSGLAAHSRDQNPCLLVNRNTSEGTVQLFRYANSDVGSVSVTSSSTAFNTSSDYRLKENVSYDFDATSRLKQLKPSRFNFIADADTTVDGFLAHEVSSIVPEAITGDKDATETKTKVVVNSSGVVIHQDVEEADWTAGKVADEDGNTQYPTDSTWEASKVVPVYQGIDQSKLVPLMVKTIQELEARIKTLEDA